MTHRKLAVILAAVLFAGSASTALAQGTGGARAPSPGIGGGGIGGGGTFIAPTPGIGTGAMPGTGITPTPGIGTGAPPNITPTPGIGTTPNPSGTLTGGPPSASGRDAFGREASERKQGSERRAKPAAWRTSRRKPRQVSPTNHVPPTSDFRTGSRCALVFRGALDRTTRRDSASDQRG